MRKHVAQDLRKVFGVRDIDGANEELKRFVELYKDGVPHVATWAENNISEGLTVFQIRSEHRKRIRTTNMLERQNKEIKRRTRVATLFSNGASLLRLVTSVLV